MRLLDGAGAAHHGGNADVLEQPRFGRIAHLALVLIGGECAHQLRDRRVFGGFKCWCRRALHDVDARIGEFALHAGQQLVLHIGIDLRLNAVRRHARQIAEFVDEFAQLGNRVHRDAALNLVGRHRGERHIEELVVRAMLLEVIGDIADPADEPRRVFDRVRALGRKRRMRCLAMHAAAVDIDALVRHDHLHAGRLAHHAAVEFHAAQLEFIEHERRARAAHFFVIRQRKVDRLVALHAQKIRHQSQPCGDEALHVATAARIQAAVAFGHRKRVGVPLLAIDRHHVRMAGQHDAALSAAIPGGQGRKQIGLVAFGRAEQLGLDALRGQAIAHFLDQTHVGVAAGGVMGHQRVQPFTGGFPGHFNSLRSGFCRLHLSDSPL